ncbi:MAG: CinA family protein [Ruminococcaceae bacterium]|nr:CinA family protein [Oscillospiraceae bacterium]
MDEARRVIEALQRSGKTLVTAESCTGGLLGKLLTDVPGASSVYLGGVISYAYALKEQLLGVDKALLDEKGAVCEEVAIALAKGAKERLHADVALSITGNAGPGTDEKNPNVGEIYVACADENGCTCRKLQLSGSREENRMAACEAALALILIAD